MDVLAFLNPLQPNHARKQKQESARIWTDSCLFERG